jgi:hypothetical protein
MSSARRALLTAYAIDDGVATSGTRVRAGVPAATRQRRPTLPLEAPLTTVRRPTLYFPATARPDNAARASLRMAGTGLNLRRRWHRCHHAAAQLARRLAHMTRYPDQGVGLYVVVKNGDGVDVGAAAPRPHMTDHL